MSMTQNEIYALADNLQMAIEVQGKKLAGSKPFSVKFGDMRLEGEMAIVSSAVFDKNDGGGAVVCKIVGDLGLVMSVDTPWIKCAVVDLAKLSANRGHGYLEALKVKTHETLWTHLREHPATRATFARRTPAAWQPATV